jgi:hypothetical protein
MNTKNTEATFTESIAVMDCERGCRKKIGEKIEVVSRQYALRMGSYASAHLSCTHSAKPFTAFCSEMH